jgi:hypothetical protein
VAANLPLVERSSTPRTTHAIGTATSPRRASGRPAARLGAPGWTRLRRRTCRRAHFRRGPVQWLIMARTERNRAAKAWKRFCGRGGPAVYEGGHGEARGRGAGSARRGSGGTDAARIGSGGGGAAGGGAGGAGRAAGGALKGWSSLSRGERVGLDSPGSQTARAAAVVDAADAAEWRRVRWRER